MGGNRRRQRLIGATLLTAFVTMLSVQCVASASASELEMACCAAMGAECGTSMAQHPCCSSEALKVTQQRPAPRLLVAPPVPVLIAQLVFDSPSSVRRDVADRHGPDGLPPLINGTGTYLRLSLLRI
jgi:hypothetical protein